MRGGQIAALIFAIILLLPGGCFLFLGMTVVTDAHYMGAGFLAMLVAAAFLGLAGLLFWIAFRRRRPSPGQTPGNTPS